MSQAKFLRNKTFGKLRHMNIHPPNHTNMVPFHRTNLPASHTPPYYSPDYHNHKVLLL